MTRDENDVKSFLDLEPNEIALATRLDEIPKVEKSCNQEGWCVAWTPDNRYIAWSQGGGIVYMLPWDGKHNRILRKPTRDISCENLSDLLNEPFIDNLPRLPSHVENDESFHWDKETEQPSTDNEVDQPMFRIDCMDFVWSMAFGSGVPDPKIEGSKGFSFTCDLILATGLQGGKIKLWNAYTGVLLIELLDHKSVVRGLSFINDGSLILASCSNDLTIKFWDLNQDYNMYKTLHFKENVMVYGCKWSPNSKLFAAVGMNKCAYVYKTSDFNDPRKLVGHQHNIVCCDFSPDGALFATASFDTRVIIWDPYTGDQIKVLGHMFPSPRLIYAGGANEHYVRHVCFSSHGHKIATVADDGYLRFWSLDSLSQNPKCIAESPKPLSCAYSPNGTVVATGCRNGSLQLYRPEQPTVPSLQHLCRITIRQHLHETEKVDSLHFPERLKEFIKYRLL